MIKPMKELIELFKMRTPMQELIELFKNRLSLLKEVKATAIGEFKFLLQAQIDELEICIISAESLLEKEKEVIVRSFMNVSDDKDTRLEDVHLREFAEQYYNETFKTKENGNTKFRPRNRKT